ncbi:hypothetical protein PPACK8108_LOCUS3871 [Phakopsora pachyrhizi]|uniref:Retrotransposon gag domain-containing protein n=1 Tax=Phakopsora pachyrhizi TaxID=170000 RepID=A0AAV0AN19_PHAPC|nr:hypothetical protein PPACK8108_LOCUS3871 [Phakopsora pachyrhizi]
MPVEHSPIGTWSNSWARRELTAEKKSIEEYKTQFEPLLKFMKKELEEFCWQFCDFGPTDNIATGGFDELAKVEAGNIKPAPPIEERPLEGSSGGENHMREAKDPRQRAVDIDCFEEIEKSLERIENKERFKEEKGCQPRLRPSEMINRMIHLKDQRYTGQRVNDPLDLANWICRKTNVKSLEDLELLKDLVSRVKAGQDHMEKPTRLNN